MYEIYSWFTCFWPFYGIIHNNLYFYIFISEISSNNNDINNLSIHILYRNIILKNTLIESIHYIESNQIGERANLDIIDNFRLSSYMPKYFTDIRILNIIYLRPRYHIKWLDARKRMKRSFCYYLCQSV